jgi:hypothetical protein
MAGMFRTHRGNEKCIQRFGWKTSREGTAWETYVLAEWEDNIQVTATEIGCEGVDCI